ncbi:MAG TPA: glycoside hydrolase family 76 protein [Acidimicrobiales bacterium]|nr:glycoside hydrolase family 76 protein [Acidimicrobiales bacterium]
MQSVKAQVDQQRAIASYEALQQYLYVPASQLYVAPAPTTSNPFAFLWPFTNAMAATDYLAGTPGGKPYSSDLDARLGGLLQYQDASEHTPSGTVQPPAFQSAVAPPLGSGGDTYYDDNAWTSLELLHQYHLTGSLTDLALAEESFRFVVTGWSTDRSSPCPGGVYWVDASWSGDRNTVSNAPNAEVGVQLYELTGSSYYLAWANRMYEWVNRCLAAPNGLYYDHISSAGTINTTEWSYNQGTMIGAGVLLYGVTGKASYLNRAIRTAQAAVAYYGMGKQLEAQGPAFNGIYFRNLFLLDQLRPRAAYKHEAEFYGSYMWSHDRDPSTGLFLPLSAVNATAPMVEIYSLLAGSSP